MPARSEDLIDELPEVEQDLYELLNVKKDATEEEIRSAYRRQALKHHPDKVPAAEQEAAKEIFQQLSLAYAVLSNKRRRDYYDTTGNTSELLENDSDFSWRDYFKAQYEDIITIASIEKIKNEYQNSDEERADLLAAFEEHEGDLDAIFEEIMCSSVLDDEVRFRKIIDAAIKSGEVTPYPAYKGETAAKRKRRVAAAKKEAEEAREYAEELGVADQLFPEEAANGKKSKKQKKEDSEAALLSLIQKRQQDRGATFLDSLEAKYMAVEKEAKAAKKPKTKGKSKKRTSDDEDEEMDDGPSEEAFNEMANRGKQAKTEKSNKRPTKKQRT